MGRHSFHYHGVAIHGSLDCAWLHSSQGHDTRPKIQFPVSWSTPCPDMTYRLAVGLQLSLTQYPTTYGALRRNNRTWNPNESDTP
jgi:hypothetical protein